jgi:hypothetical protein
MSTVRSADKVVDMSQGKVVEEGTHDELIRKENGACKVLAELQSQSEPQQVQSAEGLSRPCTCAICDTSCRVPLLTPRAARKYEGSRRFTLYLVIARDPRSPAAATGRSRGADRPAGAGRALDWPDTGRAWWAADGAWSACGSASPARGTTTQWFIP